MNDILRPITALLIAIAILLLGNGLQTVLIPIRAEAEGFLAVQIGSLGTAYFAGLFAGCFVCPAAVTRVGHIRAFAAFAAAATLAPLVHAMFPDVLVWWALRLVTGICFAGLYIVIESWLNGVADNANRGTILSLYTVINMTVVAAGQMLIVAGDPNSFELFSLVAILIALAVIPVALSRESAPHPPQAARLRLAWIWDISPLAVAGCLATGLANGAFWTLGPVYATGAGLPVPATAAFMSASVLAGALVQWPLGFLSDRRDRRQVIAATGAAAALAGLVLSLSAGAPPALVIALGGLFGAGSMPLYALSLAHANDFAAREEAVDLSSGLLLLYALGAAGGPMLASGIMVLFGTAGLFQFTLAVHAALVAFATLRMRRREAPDVRAREAFVAVPRTSPVVFALDPRTPPEDEETHAG